MVSKEEINEILDELHFQPYGYEDDIDAIRSKAAEMCADDLTNYIVDYTIFDNSVIGVKFGEYPGDFELEMSESYPIYIGEIRKPSTASISGNLPYNVDYGFGSYGSTDKLDESSEIFDITFNNTDFPDDNYEGVSINDIPDIASENNLSSSQCNNLKKMMNDFINQFNNFIDYANDTVKTYHNVAEMDINTDEEYEIMSNIVDELGLDEIINY